MVTEVSQHIRKLSVNSEQESPEDVSFTGAITQETVNLAQKVHIYSFSTNGKDLNVLM